MNVLATTTCFSQPHESMLLPHFDDHPPLPAEKILLCSCKAKKFEAHSYHVCLDRMKKAFERRSIVPVPGLGISLPFRQAF
jgi:hypothetical protein